MSATGPLHRQTLMPKLRAAFEFAQQQIRNLITRHPGYHPTYTVSGRWGYDTGEAEPGSTHESEGFLPSMLWMFARRTADVFWFKQAEAYTRRLEERKDDTESSDIGLIFLNTFARWYRQTADRRFKEVVIQAGRTLARRWQPKGEYLASYRGRGSLLIGAAMNAEVIFLTAKSTQDVDLYEIARRTCRTVQRYLVREDGGTAEEGLFDPASGRFQREGNIHGVRPGSVWARGLAMAIYGFGSAYHYSREEDFLHTAEECAQFYLDRAAPDMAVPWDFAAVPAKRMVDSSAMALAANGFWNLAGLTKSQENRLRYARAALLILDTLCGNTYLTQSHPGQEGILLHGVYNMPANRGVNESTAWGDHYFVEAIYKVTQPRPTGKDASSKATGVVQAKPATAGAAALRPAPIQPQTGPRASTAPGAPPTAIPARQATPARVGMSRAPELAAPPSVSASQSSEYTPQSAIMDAVDIDEL